jgi:DNA-binding NtrC family response regulator
MNRVLLVGEDSRVSHSVAGTLCGLGYGVDVAYDSRTALFLAGRRDYTHVLIDHEIDESNGIGLFQKLVKLQCCTGVLLTAATNLNTVVSAIDAGIRRVLAKPVDYRQLLPLLKPARCPVKSTSHVRTFSESQIAKLSQYEIREQLEIPELIEIIRGVEYPFAGKERLEHFDRDTLERVVHLVCRWCRQRQKEPVASDSELILA